MSDDKERRTEGPQLQNSVERVSVERNEHDKKLSCKVQDTFSARLWVSTKGSWQCVSTYRYPPISFNPNHLHDLRTATPKRPSSLFWAGPFYCCSTNFAVVI